MNHRKSDRMVFQEVDRLVDPWPWAKGQTVSELFPGDVCLVCS